MSLAHDECGYRREIDPDTLDLPVMSRDALTIDDDFGTRRSIHTVQTETFLGLRRALRELNMGSIPIYSPYDCTGLVCGQWCKLIAIYRVDGFYIGVVELTVSRDV